MGQPMKQFDDDQSATGSDSSSSKQNAPPARLINFRTESAILRASHAEVELWPVYRPTSSVYQPSGNEWTGPSPVYASTTHPEDPFITRNTSIPANYPVQESANDRDRSYSLISPVYQPTSPAYYDTGDVRRTYNATSPAYRMNSLAHGPGSSRYNADDGDALRAYRPTSPIYRATSPQYNPEDEYAEDVIIIRPFQPDSPVFQPTTPPRDNRADIIHSPHGSTGNSSSASETQAQELRLRAYHALNATNALNSLRPEDLESEQVETILIGGTYVTETAIINAAISYLSRIRHEALEEAVRLMTGGREGDVDERDA